MADSAAGLLSFPVHAAGMEPVARLPAPAVPPTIAHRAGPVRARSVPLLAGPLVTVARTDPVGVAPRALSVGPTTGDATAGAATTAGVVAPRAAPAR